MNVLVTGATGFVGGHLVPELLKRNFKVICLVRNMEKGKVLKKKYGEINLIQGDVTKPETLKGISENIDYVIHLAAMGHVSAVTEESFKQFVDINEIGTKNLIKEFLSSKQLKKFIHFSSTAAMGPALSPVLDEQSLPNPKTPYQRSKYRSEQIVIKAFKEHQFPGLIVRPCMIYGPGGYGEFHKFCRLMKKGVFPKVGLGKNLTPLVYVKDVVSATILALGNGHPGESYIIASEQSIPMDELRKDIVNAIGTKSPYFFVPSFLALFGAKVIETLFPILGKEPIVTYANIKSTIVDRTFDINKAKSELEYEPSYSFEEGIEKTIRWYKSQGRI
ncbi:NAD(P)-dependent oxidoreductase [Frisingicoccus caecimuris]|uniref:Nucleoside-diphosphate-sugar epimerase n=1 Tax=Frisingicoccus caecimuris TaxID=1796636 RepID=A0A4R2LF97_9FIRM|nr:NAD(P)-dependent oxidoreductase [Frisingicoccus caecimuris]MCR1919991.1 NAD(P)-dependent oxidoreductase [Frisingicoccus caecimuris]TCO81603.1 nucleoside-diphosphate-sugar epimerase [Frisingicoccus caecimuris]